MDPNAVVAWARGAKQEAKMVNRIAEQIEQVAATTEPDLDELSRLGRELEGAGSQISRTGAAVRAQVDNPTRHRASA